MADIISLPIARRSRVPVARPLDGRVAIVTGSTRGIGLGIASALAAAGAMIVLNGSGSEAEIDNLRHVLGARHDVPVRHDGADMNDDEAIAAMVARTERTFGPVDILVNNTCIQQAATKDLFPTTERDAVVAVNMSAVFHASRTVLPEMKRCGWGRIVNVAWTCGLIGSACSVAEVTAEHDLIGLTRTIALNGARHGVTCNAICLGRAPGPPAERQAATNRPGNGSSATVTEIASVVSFLCGPAAGSITGAVIPIDAALRMR